MAVKKTICAALLAMLLPVQAAALPAMGELHAKSAALYAANGQELFSMNGDEALQPASVTKVMTLLLAMEALERGEVTLDTMVTGSEYACSMGGTQVWLEPGEQLSFDEMLKAVAVGSANDCAVAIAEHLAGSEVAFVERMNARAAELGCTGTLFINANGLDGMGEKTMTTARGHRADLVRAAAASQDPGLHRHLDGQHPRREIFAGQHQQDAQKLSGPDRTQDRLYLGGGLLHFGERPSGTG